LRRENNSKRHLRLEVELLESRHLLSPVFFVPMSPIALGVGGSDITSAVGDFNGDGLLDVLSSSSHAVGHHAATHLSVSRRSLWPNSFIL